MHWEKFYKNNKILRIYLVYYVLLKQQENNNFEVLKSNLVVQANQIIYCSKNFSIIILIFCFC